MLIILDLFEALADLFQNKCKAQGLEIFDSDDKYTRTFEKWCRKLHEADITRKDIRRGLTHLEEAVRDAVRNDNEMWPPDFASFIGHCQTQKERGQWYKRLPKPQMTDEQKKEAMKKLRGDLNI